MCGHSQHTYLYTQVDIYARSSAPPPAQSLAFLPLRTGPNASFSPIARQAVLAHLVRDRTGYHMKRLAQELTNSTVEHGQVGRKLSYLLSDSHRFPNIAEALLAMLTSNATNPADVIKVLLMLGHFCSSHSVPSSSLHLLPSHRNSSACQYISGGCSYSCTKSTSSPTLHRWSSCGTPTSWSYSSGTCSAPPVRSALPTSSNTSSFSPTLPP
jgi:hypothetical protein